MAAEWKLEKPRKHTATLVATTFAFYTSVCDVRETRHVAIQAREIVYASEMTFGKIYLPSISKHLSREELFNPTAMPSMVKSTTGTSTTTASIPISTPTAATIPTVSTPIGRPTSDPDSPPLSYMIVGDVQQESGIASYCWNQTCADYISFATAREPIDTGLQFDATFLLLPKEEPRTLAVMTFKVRKEDERILTGSTWRWWIPSTTPHRGALEPHRVSNRSFTFTDEGLYVLALVASWRSEQVRGDIDYGFLINVNQPPFISRLSLNRLFNPF